MASYSHAQNAGKCTRQIFQTAAKAERQKRTKMHHCPANPLTALMAGPGCTLDPKNTQPDPLDSLNMERHKMPENNHAYFRFDQDFVKKGDGGAIAAAGYAYITRTGQFQNRDGETGRVIASGSDFMPQWAADDPSLFWKMFDAHADTEFYRQMIALPRGLTDAQYSELGKRLSDHLSEQEKGLRTPCTWAIHDHKASDGGHNVHLHRLIARNCDDGIQRPAPQFFMRAARKYKQQGGAPKVRKIRTKEYLIESRKQSAQIINDYCQQHGLNITVSADTYEEQGRLDDARRRRERLTRQDWEEHARIQADIRRTEEQRNEYQAKLEKFQQEAKEAEEEAYRMRRQLKRQQEEEDRDRMTPC